MNDYLKQILKANTFFTDEDYQIARDIRHMMQMPGWKHLEEKIWPDLVSFLKKKAYGAKKEDVAWKLIGLMEGHDLTIEIVKKFLRLAEEKNAELSEEKKLDELRKEYDLMTEDITNA